MSSTKRARAKCATRRRLRLLTRFARWHASLLAVAALLSGLSCAGRDRVEKVTVPSGSSVVVSLESRLNTGSNEAGDSFEGKTLEPIRAHGRVVMDPGARVDGRLLAVDRGNRNGGRARMVLAFDRITDVHGSSYLVEASPLTWVGGGGSSLRDDVGDPVGIGSMSHAGIGSTMVVSENEIVLVPGQKLRLELVTPMILPALASAGESRVP
jgi:hypothetical protein